MSCNRPARRSPFVDCTIKFFIILVLISSDRFVSTMFARFFNRCWPAVVVFFFMAVPVWAQDGNEPQEWVISYAIMVAFLALIMLILLRPTRRDDSAFSYDEQQAQKEEDMKKIKSSH